MSRPLIYLIDDSEATNSFNELQFKKIEPELDIQCFSDAKVALDLLKSNLQNEEKPIPKIIMLDLRMPNFNGFDFLEAFELLPTEKKKKIHLYVSSSIENENDFDRLIEFKIIKGFVIKPTQEKEIDYILKNIDR
jgi:response regulator RpfG family c-di-GMP phosphodiesterase